MYHDIFIVVISFILVYYGKYLVCSEQKIFILHNTIMHVYT